MTKHHFLAQIFGLIISGIIIAFFFQVMLESYRKQLDTLHQEQLIRASADGCHPNYPQVVTTIENGKITTVCNTEIE